jgi:hypothetical protein
LKPPGIHPRLAVRRGMQRAEWNARRARGGPGVICVRRAFALREP